MTIVHKTKKNQKTSPLKSQKFSEPQTALCESLAARDEMGGGIQREGEGTGFVGQGIHVLNGVLGQTDGRVEVLHGQLQLLVAAEVGPVL